MELRINLNERIKVKLTDLGKEIYYHRVDHVNEWYGRVMVKPSFPKVDEDGYTTFQLWDFMGLYGEHIGMAKPNVIEPLEIIYGKEDLPSAQPEIIHCKDCKQFRRWIDTDICFCDITESERSDNDFCSKAERRTDGSD